MREKPKIFNWKQYASMNKFRDNGFSYKFS